MRNCISILFLIVFCSSCEPIGETNIERFTITGQVINVNNPTKFDGMHFYLESNTYSQISGTIIETISEDIVSDSGKFDFLYEEVGGTGLTIKCHELPNFSKRVNPNLNLTPTYYVADSSTLIITFNSINPLPTGDTLYFRYNMPYMPQDASILIGPILSNTHFIIRNVNAGDYSFTYGRGYNDLIKFGNIRYKGFKIRGDPFVDSVVVNY